MWRIAIGSFWARRQGIIGDINFSSPLFRSRSLFFEVGMEEAIFLYYRGLFPLCSIYYTRGPCEEGALDSSSQSNKRPDSCSVSR